MPLKVYNTLGKRKMDFVPKNEGKVGMYVCGVTVYDYCHIGHARSALAFDMIYRYLKYRGYDVTYVRNFTDIDDKIIARAKEEGVDFREISERYIEAFYEDMDSLGLLRPDVEPKATEHIPEMIEMVKALIDKGYAYEVEGDVYYNVEGFKEYGKLSGRSPDELKVGARIEIDEKKKNPLDFALWKASKPNEPFWESPWGLGRPGWHIECSVMSMKYLGPTLDIHGGGLDLVFPHHENEIAQSEAYTGEPFALYWLHNGFVSVEKEKMSKSLGNVLLIKDMLKTYHPEILRLFLLSTHYRSPIDFSFSAIEETKEALDRLYRALELAEELKGERGEIKSSEGKDVAETLNKKKRDLIAAMDDDFNSALALAKVFEGARELNRFVTKSAQATGEKAAVAERFLDLVESTRDIFGILALTSKEWFTASKEELPISVQEIENLIKERDEARRKKDWKKADSIRQMLNEKGIILEDTPKGTVWRLKK